MHQRSLAAKAANAADAGTFSATKRKKQDIPIKIKSG
jgi:hypothetical protein